MDTIFNAVFFVVVASTLLQAPTLEPLARRLTPVDPRPTSTADPIAVDAAGTLELAHFDFAADHAIAGAAISKLGLPRHALVAVVTRSDQNIPPGGSTRVEPGDRLLVLVPRQQLSELEDVFSQWWERIRAREE